MRRASYALFWVLAAVTLIGWAAEKIKPVTITAHPTLGMTGKSLCIAVIVPRHADNRILATAIDCDRYFRSWQEQLNGGSAPYARRTCIEQMPAGQCVIGASLFRVDPSQKGGIGKRNVLV